jgi:hypothetical protein
MVRKLSEQLMVEDPSEQAEAPAVTHLVPERSLSRLLLGAPGPPEMRWPPGRWIRWVAGEPASLREDLIVRLGALGVMAAH